MIDSLDVQNVRPVIDAVERLQDQRQKKMAPAMLISRWAEADPQSALAYAQAQENGTANWLLPEVITTWAEHDSVAATAWVMARDRALQSLVPVLAEADPKRALDFLRTLPAADPALYASVFSILANADPAKAAQQAMQLPAGDSRVAALQLIASS